MGDFEVVVIPEDDGTSVVTSYFRRRLSRAMNGTILTCAVTNSVMVDLNLESASTNVTLLISCEFINKTIAKTDQRWSFFSTLLFKLLLLQ